MRRGRVVGEFAAVVSRRARAGAGPARDLVEELGRHAEQLGLDPSAVAGRLATARRAVDLLKSLESLETLDSPRAANDLVTMLADADLGGSAERLAVSISSAQQVSRALAVAPWDTIDMLAALGEPDRERADDVAEALRKAARADELTQSLPDALAEAGLAAAALVREALRRMGVRTDVPNHPEEDPPPPDPVPYRRGVTPPRGPDDWDTSVLDRAGTWYGPRSPGGQGDGVRDRSTPRRLATAASGEALRWKVGAADLERAVAELRDAVGDTPGEIEINWWPAL